MTSYRAKAPSAKKPSTAKVIRKAATSIRDGRKTHLSLEERKRFLRNEYWISAFSKWSVTCKGCGMKKSLDKRHDYYFGFWLKHKKRCTSIPDAQRDRVISAEDQEFPIEESEAESETGFKQDDSMMTTETVSAPVYPSSRTQQHSVLAISVSMTDIGTCASTSGTPLILNEDPKILRGSNGPEKETKTQAVCSESFVVPVVPPRRRRFLERHPSMANIYTAPIAV